MSLISDIISGVISPLTTAVTAVFTKKEDVSLEKFKVDGQVDNNLINAYVILGQAKVELLKNHWIVALQVGFGAPLMVYYGKCILWDKVFGWGRTDSLTGDIQTYSLMIVSFLFAHSILDSWGRKT